MESVRVDTKCPSNQERVEILISQWLFFCMVPKLYCIDTDYLVKAMWHGLQGFCHTNFMYLTEVKSDLCVSVDVNVITTNKYIRKVQYKWVSWESGGHMLLILPSFHSKVSGTHWMGQFLRCLKSALV